jgi:hypothetical protein
MPLWSPSAVAVAPSQGSAAYLLPSRRKRERSATPMGFARAFFEANR